ncbi:MAG: hypothetical protein ACLUEC_10350 [Coprococcus sp.]
MRKYLVVDERKCGDVFQDVFDTLEEANAEAEYQWDHLTRTEQKERRVFVGHVEDNEKYLNDWAFDEDTGEVDWATYHSLGVEDNYFDSDRI